MGTSIPLANVYFETISPPFSYSLSDPQTASIGIIGVISYLLFTFFASRSFADSSSRTSVSSVWKANSPFNRGFLPSLSASAMSAAPMPLQLLLDHPILHMKDACQISGNFHIDNLTAQRLDGFVSTTTISTSSMARSSSLDLHT